MRVFFPGGLLAAVLFSACSGESPQPTAPTNAPKPAQATAAVEGYVVKTAALSEDVTASGTLVPAEETELHPESSGRVVQINLPEGKAVKKGDLLLKVFDEDLKTQVQKAQTQLKQAEITEQRLGELLKVKGVSQQEYDLAALQVQTLRSEIDLLRINVAKTELRAPYDGVLGLRRISPGAYVTPASVVTTIRAASALKLDFSVPEKYSHLLRSGQSISFRVEGSAETHQAVVQATEQRIDENTRNLAVRAQVLRSKGLLPGAFATVNLSVGNNAKAMLIPSPAIIPQARDKKVIVNRSGKATFVTVKTGVRQAGMVEVTEGLQVGDTIAVTGMLFLRPDATLRFSKVE
jgi:membrane fusion protein, multidrug efflux system